MGLSGIQVLMTNFSILVSSFWVEGVQNIDQGGANAPPFAMPKSLVPCGFAVKW